jgi:hypothetical protein
MTRHGLYASSQAPRRANMNMKNTHMDNERYRRSLDRLKLSIVGAAPVLGLSRRQSQRLASGDSPVPTPAERHPISP